jgi:HSP90 family molecular chaperone
MHPAALLVQVHTSKSPEKLTSLDDYISRMKPDQKDILYIAGAQCAMPHPHMQHAGIADAASAFLVHRMSHWLHGW